MPQLKISCQRTPRLHTLNIRNHSKRLHFSERVVFPLITHQLVSLLILHQKSLRRFTLPCDLPAPCSSMNSIPRVALSHQQPSNDRYLKTRNFWSGGLEQKLCSATIFIRSFFHWYFVCRYLGYIRVQVMPSWKYRNQIWNVLTLPICLPHNILSKKRPKINEHFNLKWHYFPIQTHRRRRTWGVGFRPLHVARHSRPSKNSFNSSWLLATQTPRTPGWANMSTSFPESPQTRVLWDTWDTMATNGKIYMTHRFGIEVDFLHQIFEWRKFSGRSW